MARLTRQIIDIPAENVPGIERMFGQMLSMDVQNVPPKYRKAFDATKDIASGKFRMKGIFESFELDRIEEDSLILKNGVAITSAVMAEAFRGAFELVFCVVSLDGYEEVDETETNLFNKLFLDNWGTAYIECADSWLAKTIARELEEEGVYATHSFSPGQADIPIEMQEPLFRLLRPEDIGVSLNQKLMMHPKKSVSGIIALKREPDENRIRPCDICERRDTCPNVHLGDF